MPGVNIKKDDTVKVMTGQGAPARKAAWSACSRATGG